MDGWAWQGNYMKKFLKIPGQYPTFYSKGLLDSKGLQKIIKSSLYNDEDYLFPRFEKGKKMVDMEKIEEK